MPTQASDGLGNTTFSSYDAVGRLTSRTDPNGGTYGFTYDPVGRLTSETDPLGGSIQFSYDAAGQRTSFTNPNGAGRSWTYDAGGRVTSHSDELGVGARNRVGVPSFKYLFHHFDAHCLEIHIDFAAAVIDQPDSIRLTNRRRPSKVKGALLCMTSLRAFV